MYIGSENKTKGQTTQNHVVVLRGDLTHTEVSVGHAGRHSVCQKSLQIMYKHRDSRVA